MRTPVLYMLIGPPYAGKSTWIKEQIQKNANQNYAIIDTDSWIEERARLAGQTYAEMVHAEMPIAKSMMMARLRSAIKANSDIYWDQTNMSKGSRKGKLKNIPDYYDKVAVVFKTPQKAELERRIALRKNKEIPQYVLDKMADSYNEPTYDEGFTRIIRV